METDADEEFQALRRRAYVLGVRPRRIALNEDRCLRMAMLDYSPFSGEQAAMGYVSLSLCTHRVAPVRRRTRHGTLNGVLRPGMVSVAVPDEGADVRWGEHQAIGIGIDFEAVAERLALPLTHASLTVASTRLHNDPLLSSVMTALWHEGETHGLSGAFFDHGVALVLNRLSELGGHCDEQRSVRPLTSSQLISLRHFLTDNLESGASVSDMARLLGRSPAGFSRALRQAVGLPPYQYLTSLRMTHAEALLREGVPVTQVSLSVGYTNPSKFAAAFKRYKGQLPSQMQAV